MIRILIIDDDEKIIRMLTRRLRKANFEVHFALNGKEGIDYCAYCIGNGR